ncbi:MAG: ABC transporter permease [Melioribacteraceae bacterium]|nr:ABC transporter permease [Melioribacteraceae bacterium]
MFNNRVIAVIKRELKEKLFSKAFIIMTLLIPGLILVFGGVQALLYSTDSKNLKFDFVVEEAELIPQFKTEFANTNFVKSQGYEFNYLSLNRDELNQYLEEMKPKVLEEKLTGIFFVPLTALKDKKVEYYSKSPQNISLNRELDGPINKVLLDSYFSNKSLTNDELIFARKGVDFAGFKISKEEAIAEAGYGNLIISYAFTFLLYMSLLIMGQMTMQSVIEEKSSKIVEVLLSSLSPKELMSGKILGASITGGAQMAVWLITILGVSSSALIALPKEITLSIQPELVIYVLINFFIGLVMFTALFATVGSIFDNPQDASGGTMPIMMLIIIPFFIAISMMENPNKPYAEIASMIPFSSVIVMPARMALIDVPLWQQIGAIVFNIAALFAIFPLAGKIYRVGILWTGKKPKWSEVIKWLKYKY